MYFEIFIIRLSPLKASATLGIALIVSYVQVRHATIQANGTLANVDQTESMFKFRGGSLIFPKRFVNDPKSSLNDRYWPETTREWRSSIDHFDLTSATFDQVSATLVTHLLFWRPHVILTNTYRRLLFRRPLTDYFRVCWSVQWDYICINFILFGNSSCNFLFVIFCNFISAWNATSIWFGNTRHAKRKLFKTPKITLSSRSRTQLYDL